MTRKEILEQLLVCKGHLSSLFCYQVIKAKTGLDLTELQLQLVELRKERSANVGRCSHEDGPSGSEEARWSSGEDSLRPARARGEEDFCRIGQCGEHGEAGQSVECDREAPPPVCESDLRGGVTADQESANIGG